LILKAVVAITCGCLGSKIERRARERDAAKKISELGGYVTYETFGPAWLRGTLGDNLFSEVTEAHLDRFSNSDLATARDALRELPHLKKPLIIGPGLSESALASVSGLTQLETLMFVETRFTDAGLVSLKRLSGLRFLMVRGEFSDTAIGNLKRRCPTARSTIERAAPANGNWSRNIKYGRRALSPPPISVRAC
jgi:hypothetical protein